MARKRFNFYIDDELRDGLREVLERDGIGESEQVRRAIRKWLEEKGVRVKSETGRRRAVTRRRP